MPSSAGRFYAFPGSISRAEEEGGARALARDTDFS
jgi:hypothetical protein